MPQVLVVGSGGGALDALASVVTRTLQNGKLPALGGPPVATAAPSAKSNNGHASKA